MTQLLPRRVSTSQSSAAGQQTKERPMQQRRRGVQRWFVAAGSAAVRNWQTKAQVESNLAEAWAVVSWAASLACVDKLQSQYERALPLLDDVAKSI